MTTRESGEEAGYNVRDFGAKGDGETDDTAAFQAAVDATPAWSRSTVPGMGADLSFTTLELPVEKVATFVRVARQRRRERFEQERRRQDSSVDTEAVLRDRYARVMSWVLARRLARMTPVPLPVDVPVIEYDEANLSDFAMDMGRFVAHVRAFRDREAVPERYRTREFRVDKHVHIVRFPVPSDAGPADAG